MSSIDGGKEKAVVTLEYDGGEIVGNVRLYNFEKEPDGILSLGLLTNNEVIKAGLVRDNKSFYTFKLNGTKELDNFSVALINFVKGDAKPLLLGSTNGTSASEEALCNSLAIFEKEPTVENVKSVLDENGIYLENEEEVEKQIDEIIENPECNLKCTECKYRDAFFKLEDDLSPAPEEKPLTFFDEIKEQIDTLFGKYPEEEILKQIIPDSKWVKVDYEDKGEYYVLGLMYENGKIKYVCYGVPGVYDGEPPAELKGFSQWLPIDTTKEKGFGYWLTYQDAENGENVKLNFETV